MIGKAVFTGVAGALALLTAVLHRETSEFLSEGTYTEGQVVTSKPPPLKLASVVQTSPSRTCKPYPVAQPQEGTPTKVYYYVRNGLNRAMNLLLAKRQQLMDTIPDYTTNSTQYTLIESVLTAFKTGSDDPALRVVAYTNVDLPGAVQKDGAKSRKTLHFAKKSGCMWVNARGFTEAQVDYKKLNEEILRELANAGRSTGVSRAELLSYLKSLFKEDAVFKSFFA